MTTKYFGHVSEMSVLPFRLSRRWLVPLEFPNRVAGSMDRFRPKEETSDTGRRLASQAFSGSLFRLHSKCQFFFYIVSVAAGLLQQVLVVGSEGFRGFSLCVCFPFCISKVLAFCRNDFFAHARLNAASLSGVVELSLELSHKTSSHAWMA